MQRLRMYGGIGMSASSLHRESTDSLILFQRFMQIVAIAFIVFDHHVLCQKPLFVMITFTHNWLHATYNLSLDSPCRDGADMRSHT